MAVNPKYDEMALASLLRRGTDNKYEVHYLACWNTKWICFWCEFNFCSGTKSGNYHDLMNTENFEHWMLTQLLPNLEEPSVIVMDNAPYYSVLLEKPPSQLEEG
jgi:hypothetical protein